jgi:hypothetical protein
MHYHNPEDLSMKSKTVMKFMNSKFNVICVPWHSVSSAIVAWLRDILQITQRKGKGIERTTLHRWCKIHCLLVCSSAQMLYMLLFLLDVMEFFIEVFIYMSGMCDIDGNLFSLAYSRKSFRNHGQTFHFLFIYSSVSVG